MKNKLTLLATLLLLSYVALAQAPPEKINYQAVARDLSGNPLINQSLVVIFQIRQGSPTGASVYTETHASISTNQFGLFTAEIGGGIPSAGTFAGINWGGGLHYLSVIVDGMPIGTSQLLSVPYALHAKTATSGVPGADGHNTLMNSTPEPAGNNCANGGYFIQTWLDLNDDGLLSTGETPISYYICHGDSGSASGDDWGNQVVMTQGGNIQGDGTTSNPLMVINNDNDSTNELQNLTISGNNINISSGTGINISPTAPDTGQVLTWNGTAWIAQNATSGGDNWGTQVVVSDSTLNGTGIAGNPLSVNGILTDNQNLTLTGNTLSLTNDPTPVNLSPYLDNTDAQTLSLNANNLAISNGNSVTLPTSPTYTAGTGINLSGNIITNTAPDQTVVLNNGTGINVTGTYPAFTVTNTSPATSTSITGGGLTTVTGTSPNFAVNTPAQTLTYTAPNLTLSNGGGTVTLPSGSVTSISTGTGLTGGPITTSGTISMTNTGVTAGTYGSTTQIPQFTVDAQGRLIAASTNAITITGLPPGTTGQTLFNNAGTWTPTSNLFNDGINVGIGNGVNPIFNKLLLQGSVGTSTNTGVFLDIHNINGVNNAMSGIRFKVNGLVNTNDRFNAAIFHRWNSEHELAFAVKDNSLPNVSSSDIKMVIRHSGNVGIGTITPAFKLEVISNPTNSSVFHILNNIASGIDGNAAIFESTGSRSISNQGVVIKNLVTKVGGSNSTKAGLLVESTGSWGPSTTNQPNVGIQVIASGADNNFALQLQDGSQGAGKILTSDAQGNAQWASNSIYTSSGALNSNAVIATTTWQAIGPSLNITKTHPNSKIEVTFNSRITSGNFNTPTNGIRFEIRINGVAATYDTKGAITSPNIIDFISMFAVFNSLGVGSHIVQVYVASVGGNTTSTTLLDSGGWGGRMIAKETF